MTQSSVAKTMLEDEGKKARESYFDRGREKFEALVKYLETSRATLREVEEDVDGRGRAIMRDLIQGNMDLRAMEEDKLAEVEGSDGVSRRHRRSDEERTIGTIFGDVVVRRIRYESREKVAGLCPLDGELNLPGQKYSYSVAKRLGGWAATASFDQAIETLEQTSGITVPKRQAEELVRSSSVDFEAFYRQRPVEEIQQDLTDTTITVLTTDGKGILVYPQDLRQQTRNKLDKEYGDKLYFRKRMAQVAGVYQVEPYHRTEEAVVSGLMTKRSKGTKRPRPKPRYKRVWAGIVDRSEQLIDTIFQEALRRDPKQRTAWVAVVDGAEAQISVIKDLARAYGVEVVIICDIIHAVEYLWEAAKILYGDKQAQHTWVTAQLHRLLEGKVSLVAAVIRRAKTRRGRRLKKAQRDTLDVCANYLLNHRSYMRYDQYLEAGYPIGSGVIEGTVRHLVNDRMDITGAHWRLASAEAVLRMRALKASGDFDAYWRFHEQRQLQRQHLQKYANAQLPTVLPTSCSGRGRRKGRRLTHLRLVA